MAKAPTHRRSQRIALYLLPNVEHESIVLDVYNASRVHDRAQDLLRAALFRGLRAMYESGDIPDKILAHHNLGTRLGKRMARHAILAPPMPPAPQEYVSPPPAPLELSVPEFEAVAAPEPKEVDPMDFLALMGGGAPLSREDA